MFQVIGITNRKLCEGDFLKQIEKIVKCAPDAMILREKDLTREAYKELAKDVMELCARYKVRCILHNFVDVAQDLKAEVLHVPMHVLREMTAEEKKRFSAIGASCHSVDEAKEAQMLGCSYIIAGHIFATDCKRGLLPRGTGYLEAVCKEVEIPVYAIGGICCENAALTKMAGAGGICVMSSLMKCDEPETYLSRLRSSCEGIRDDGK